MARSSWAPCSQSSCPPAPCPAAARTWRATSSSGGGAGDNSGYTIAMVTHETPGDTFWDKIKSGAQQAAKNYGIDLKYSNDPDPAKQATLIQNAIDSKVDGIATTLATPDALAGAVEGRERREDPGRGVQLRHRPVPGRRRADVLRLRREPGRRVRGGADRRGRRQEDALRDPGVRLGGPRGAVCRCEEQGPEHREHPGERRRRLRGGLLAPGQAVPGQVHRLHRHAGRPDRARRAQGDGRCRQQGEARHLRPQRRCRPGHQGRQDRVLRSTSSPTSRATRP